MPNTVEQFGPNVVKKEPVVGATIPAGTDVQSLLVSRDQKARLGAEAEKRYRDFNVWFLSSPMYREHDEDIPDARKLSEEVYARRKDIEQETGPVHYQSFRYSELKHQLADAYPGYGDVYAESVPDLIVMYGGKGYADNEPESQISRAMLDTEVLPIRDIRRAADSVLYPSFSTRERIEGDWAGEFLDMHILGKKQFSLLGTDREITSDIAAELIATELIGTDQDWHILSKEFDEYSENGDATTLAKAVTPGRVKRAFAPDNQEMRVFKGDDPKWLRRTRLVSRDAFPFDVEINLYGKRAIAIMSFEEGFGMIIESEKIWKTLRSIFEMSWAFSEKSTYGVNTMKPE